MTVYDVIPVPTEDGASQDTVAEFEVAETVTLRGTPGTSFKAQNSNPELPFWAKKSIFPLDVTKLLPSSEQKKQVELMLPLEPGQISATRFAPPDAIDDDQGSIPLIPSLAEK